VKVVVLRTLIVLSGLEGGGFGLLLLFYSCLSPSIFRRSPPTFFLFSFNQYDAAADRFLFLFLSPHPHSALNKEISTDSQTPRWFFPSSFSFFSPEIIYSYGSGPRFVLFSQQGCSQRRLFLPSHGPPPSITSEQKKPPPPPPPPPFSPFRRATKEVKRQSSLFFEAGRAGPPFFLTLLRKDKNATPLPPFRSLSLLAE